MLRIPYDIDFYWNALYSECAVNGAIEKYVLNLCQKKNLKIVWPRSDGIFQDDDYSNLCKGYNEPCLPYILSESFLEKFQDKVIVILCSRGNFKMYKNLARPNSDISQKEIFNNLLYVPLSDTIFENGLNNLMAKYIKPDWHDRKSTLFWRGGASNYERPDPIRFRVTKALFNHPNADVKMISWNDPRTEHYIPQHFFAERADISKQLQYKYLLIVDGALISSNYQWVFGSGSVPVMLIHPDNDFWFKSFLVPMKHYVPVSYDLSDIEEKLNWLLAHDKEAEEISKNAFLFSEEYFSVSGQQKYLQDAINNLSVSSNMPNLTNLTTKINLFTDKKFCIVTYTDLKYLSKAMKTINDIRINGKYFGDLIVITDGLFTIEESYIKAMNLIVVEYPDIDTSSLINKIKQFPFVNTDKREYEKLKQWNKLYVFDKYFQKWDFVFFVDAGLRIFDEIQYFHNSFKDNAIVAMDDGHPNFVNKFSCQIEMTNTEVVNKLKEIYDINSSYFLNCLFIFDTNLIKEDTLDNLIKMMNEYPICRTNEMGIMNIYFHKEWKPLNIYLEDGRILFDWSERNGNSWKKYISLKYPVTY